MPSNQYAVTVRDEIISIECPDGPAIATVLSREVPEERLTIAENEVEIDVVTLDSTEHANMVYTAIEAVEEIAGDSPELNIIGPREAPDGFPP